jgi:3,4-dihydroxy 2-butanone 4-phosphate synthase/GTP cyclohydrolase II
MSDAVAEETHNPPSAAEAEAARFARQLLVPFAAGEATAPLQLAPADEECCPGRVALPRPALQLLLEILAHIGRGAGVSILPTEVELTSQQAAELLQVSRPFLIKLLEEGRIPHRKVGTHRRILFSDIMAYRRREAQPRLADALSEESKVSFNTIEEAIRAIAAGEMIVVVDDDDRENEGDLIVAAAKATPEQVAFMIRHTSGILCVPLLPPRARELRLNPMVQDNNAPLGTAFTVSVDYRAGLTTGISAEERTNTIRALANGNVGAEDFVRPGHIFPLVAKEGGVLVRSGHTEAAIDLARLAGLPQVGLLAELVNDDGTVKRLPELLTFAAEHRLKIVSIADLIAYRRQRERLVDRVAEFEIATEIGPARAIAYATPFDAVQHLALVFGDIAGKAPVPVRIHREEVIGDVFGGKQGSGASLSRALKRIEAAGFGVLVYLREGAAGVAASSIAQAGTRGETPPESEQERNRHWREIGVGAQILRDLGLTSITLLTSHKRGYVGLSGFGIAIAGTELIDPAPRS